MTLSFFHMVSKKRSSANHMLNMLRSSSSSWLMLSMSIQSSKGLVLGCAHLLSSLREHTLRAMWLQCLQPLAAHELLSAPGCAPLAKHEGGSWLLQLLTGLTKKLIANFGWCYQLPPSRGALLSALSVQPWLCYQLLSTKLTTHGADYNAPG